MHILSAARIELPCNNCGRTYEISLQQVELAQDALHADCQAQSEGECSPLVYAGLADGELIDRLREAWQAMEDGVRGAGGRLVLRAPEQTD